MGDGGLVGGGGDGWSSILVSTSEWSMMILPTKMQLIIVILLTLLSSLSFTLSLLLSLPLLLLLLLLLFQGMEWLPEFNAGWLHQPSIGKPVHRGGILKTRPVMISRTALSAEVAEMLAEEFLPGWRSDEGGDVVQRDDIWWFLGGYQGHAIDFDQYQDSRDEKILLPTALSWQVSPDVSSNCWIE